MPDTSHATSLETSIRRWRAERTYEASDFSLEALRDAKGTVTVSAILPARGVEATIGEIVTRLVPLERAGLIDELVVIDAGVDMTAEVAAASGAEVYQRDDILTQFGPSLGKGDALWRGLAATGGDVVLFLDTDTRNFDGSFAVGLLGPILLDPGVHLVKGAFERPLRLNEVAAEGEGGRVTELLARPLINLFFPELGGFRQPLAGEIGARRELLQSLAFPVGYGVEIAILIDAWRIVGLDGLAEVDLGRREDHSKPLSELVPMASSVLTSALRRCEALSLEDLAHEVILPSPDGVELRRISDVERPPLSSLR